jgi:hypothetical protein
MGGYWSNRWPQGYQAKETVEGCLSFTLSMLRIQENFPFRMTARWTDNETGEIVHEAPLNVFQYSPIAQDKRLHVGGPGGRTFVLSPIHRPYGTEWGVLCCGKRVRKIYFSRFRSSWGCRRCLRLAYGSQWQDYHAFWRLLGRLTPS